MTVPTQPVSGKLADFGGASVAGVIVTAKLSDVDYTADGTFVGTEPVTTVTDAGGNFVLNVFPNAVAPTGLGTRGTVLTITARPPNSKAIRVEAVIPNAPCNLVDHLVNEEQNGLSGSERAVVDAQAARDLAKDWATKTSGEVVAGQGFGAKKYAQDTASDAQQTALDRQQTALDRIATGQDLGNVVAARDVTTAARDATLTARDVTTAARDITTGARDVALALVNMRSTTAAALADAAIANNAYFSTPSAITGEAAIIYQKVGGAAVDTGIRVANADSSLKLIPPEVNSTIAFAITDPSGRRSWIEIAAGGGPTPEASRLLAQSLKYVDLSADVTAAFDAKLSFVQYPDLYVNEPLAFTVVDQSGNRSWLEVTTTGGLSSFAASKIASAVQGLLNIQQATATGYKDEKGNTRAVVSGPAITCWGDSMTAGAGGGGTTFPSVLAGLSGKSVYNAGVGGETSVTICARSGATPFIVNVQGGVIPDSGGVTITFAQINGQSAQPLLQGQGTPTLGNGIGASSSFAGALKGIPGTISYNAGTATYTFTRTTNGVAVTCDRPEPYYTDWAKARRDDVWIIWIGQNGPSDTRAIQDVKAMVQYMESLNKRWLVIPKPTSNDALDSTFFGEFGRRCVMVRKYLVDYGLQDAGITPTAQDTTDIANGVVPTSLRVDAVHFNASGYTILGNLVYQRMLELGWL